MSSVAAAPDRWRNIPVLASVAALLLVLIGLWVILYYDRVYQAQKAAEVQVQAEVLGASVTAALDFGDSAAAQESVNALRVNHQLLAAGVYDNRKRLVAGFRRGGAAMTDDLRRNPAAGSGFAVQRPIMRAGTRVGTVRLVSAGDTFARRATRYSVVGLLVGLAALVVAVLGAAHNALRRANASLAGANEALRVEIGERAKAEEALRQAQKMHALGQLTGGIAHDFNNLLTVIAGSADLLKRPEVADSKRIRFASAIAQTAARAAALTSQLLAFARRQPLRPQVIDLNRHILGMMDLLDRSLGARIEIRTDLDETVCAVEVDPTQLEVAVLNIAVNARDAMDGSGRITITTGMSGTGESRAVALSIADTGGGIPPEVVQRVFEPFFTTKSVGKGTGLGLSQVYGFIAQSGGEVSIDSIMGRGTKINMLLPCTDEVPPGEAQPAECGDVGDVARILLVEDNEEVGTFAEALLSELGHEVLRARSGEEALAMIADGAKFDVTFSDIVMPGISGLELAHRITELRPGVPVILTSGYSDQLTETGAGDRVVLAKPYTIDALTAALAKALTSAS